MQKENRKKISVRIGDIEFRKSTGNYEIVKWDGDHCYVLAFFKEQKDDEPDLVWCGRRPLKLGKGEFDDFIKCVRFGMDVLDEPNEDEDARIP
jgi:hypothetical protein